MNAAGAVVTRDNRVPRPAATRFQDVPYTTPIYNPVDEIFHPGDLTNELAEHRAERREDELPHDACRSRSRTACFAITARTIARISASTSTTVRATTSSSR